MMKLALLDAVSSWPQWALQSADNSNLHVSVSHCGVSLASACSGKKTKKNPASLKHKGCVKCMAPFFAVVVVVVVFILAVLFGCSTTKAHRGGPPLSAHQ